MFLQPKRADVPEDYTEILPQPQWTVFVQPLVDVCIQPDISTNLLHSDKNVFPKSVGLYIHENDLAISKVSQKFFSCTLESMVVKDFFLKETLESKPLIDAEGFQGKEIILSWPRERTIVREIELPRFEHKGTERLNLIPTRQLSFILKVMSTTTSILPFRSNMEKRLLSLPLRRRAG